MGGMQAGSEWRGLRTPTIRVRGPVIIPRSGPALVRRGQQRLRLLRRIEFAVFHDVECVVDRLRELRLLLPFVRIGLHRSLCVGSARPGEAFRRRAFENPSQPEDFAHQKIEIFPRASVIRVADAQRVFPVELRVGGCGQAPFMEA